MKMPALIPAIVVLAACGAEAPMAVHATSDGERPSAAFRAEHARFLADLDHSVEEALAVRADAPEAEREAHVQAVLEFFGRELVQHAGAEEAVLYDVADRLAGTPPPLRYTDVLRYEHTVVHAEIRALDEWARASDRSADSIAEFQRRVVGLAGLVRGHFGGEENVILELLDARMTEAEFERDVLAPIEAYMREHGAAHHGH